MTRWLQGILLLFCALASSQVSARASDFEVVTLDGATVPLSSYFESGKWTMVMMWTTYCGTCRSQYPAVSEFHDKHKAHDAKVIGVSLDGIDEIEKVQRYINDKPFTFDSAVVDADRLRAAYLAITEEPFTGTPTYLMFDPQGNLVAHVPGTITVKDVEAFIAQHETQ